jgi:hypothetical protein
VIENVWEYLRGNKLAITVLENYDDIVDKSCAAWRYFADDPERVEATGLSPCRAGPPKLLAVPFFIFLGKLLSDQRKREKLGPTELNQEAVSCGMGPSLVWAAWCQTDIARVLSATVFKNLDISGENHFFLWPFLFF